MCVHVLQLAHSAPKADRLGKQQVAILQIMDSLGVVLVASAGNVATADVQSNPQAEVAFGGDQVPRAWAYTKDPSDTDQARTVSLANLIVVGSVDPAGRRSKFGMGTDAQITVFAPGESLSVADATTQGFKDDTGTSYGKLQAFLLTPTYALADDSFHPYIATPYVAGLAAYFRGLPDLNPSLRIDLSNPADVKKLVRKMRRKVFLSNDQIGDQGYLDVNQRYYGRRVPSIWNGQINGDFDGSCLANPRPATCPIIDFSNDDPVGESGCISHSRLRWLGIGARQVGDSCELPPGPGGPKPGDGSGGFQGPSKVITFQSGTPSPTCTSGCGPLCSGYWCRPASDRSSQPPWFTDPTDMPADPTNVPIPTDCISTTTREVCDGAGVGKVCYTTTSCLATGKPTVTHPTDLPTLTTDPPIPTNCIPTTTWSSCLEGNHGEVCNTHSSCVATSTTQDEPDPPDSTSTWPPVLPPEFPKPDPDLNSKGLSYSCDVMGGDCKLYPELIGGCDNAAREFILNPDWKYSNVAPDVNHNVCLDGTDNDGNPVGCNIRFTAAQGDPVCQWDAGDAVQWYSDMRYTCGPMGMLCTSIWNQDFCEMVVEYVDKCP